MIKEFLPVIPVSTYKDIVNVAYAAVMLKRRQSGVLKAVQKISGNYV